MSTLEPATRQQLVHCTPSLVNEVDRVPPSVVEREVKLATANLVARARVEDYIPLLVERYTRDRLREIVEADTYTRAAA